MPTSDEGEGDQAGATESKFSLAMSRVCKGWGSFGREEQRLSEGRGGVCQYNRQQVGRDSVFYRRVSVRLVACADEPKLEQHARQLCARDRVSTKRAFTRRTSARLSPRVTRR